MQTNRLSPVMPLVGIVAGLALALCQYMIFVYAPVEQTMGIVQKIFYFHMPLAWWSLISFLTVFVASIAFLRTRNWKWDALSGAAAEVGVLFSGLALITGSIWGRHSWGVWWTWDPRLTTTLVMWFVYAGYLVLRTLDLPRERLGTVSAVVGIVAFLDVPLVFLSARLWRSIHPAVFASKGGGLEAEMKTTVIACIVAFGFLWVALTWLRAAQRRMAARIDVLATETTI
ncbi:cytochrome c biogenesis protein [Nitratidesulfovibrio liaohensis]|uniref:cytochrome c biogenesis protein n=1 Tax=Nitratidesulfovibrio liaohensis TaxID=2604158 RepID=UPI0014229046|nr:cytochrome c biogenesis protein CcsA [Nitratidesulfovibrio liaohensis]NHZ48837.1 cytochrome C biogenesis protein CcmC [Nitratidesulfovibrio liaohensis]